MNIDKRLSLRVPVEFRKKIEWCEKTSGEVFIVAMGRVRYCNEVQYLWCMTVVWHDVVWCVMPCGQCVEGIV